MTGGSIRSNRARAWMMLGAMFVLALLAKNTWAQQPSGSAAQSAFGTGPLDTGTASASDKPATLADFAWLVGSWQGTWGPRLARQDWMAPSGGTMVGTFQLAENDKTLVIELFTMRETPGGIEYRIRHFTPALQPWEKNTPATLKLQTADGKTMTFENPLDGQPKHAIFIHVDPDTFISRSEILPEKGDLQIVNITYHRRRDTSPAAPVRH